MHVQERKLQDGKYVHRRECALVEISYMTVRIKYICRMQSLSTVVFSPIARDEITRRA